MNMLVLGGGFLGKRIAEEFDAEILTERIKNANDLSEAISRNVMEWPDVIVNCIGKTGRPNVDWCEKNKAETYVSNVHVPYLLAEFCKRHDIKLVHISSGCVYQGDNQKNGWGEEDEPNFTGSFYSFTKAAAEKILSEYANVLTLRIRMPIDSTPNDRELIGKLLKYDKVINTPNSVTVVQDLLDALRALLANDSVGIFNVVNPEPVTHKQILDIYEEVSGKKLNKTYIEAKDLVTDAPRSNCILNTNKLTQSASMRNTETAIRDAIMKYVQNGG